MKLIGYLESIYLKLPSLSPESKHFIVKILPFLTIITGAVITFSSIVDLIGTPFLNVLTMGEGTTIFQKLMVVNILGVIEGVLMIIAFRKLRKVRRSGWMLIFWSQIIFIISAFLSFSPSFLLGLVFLYPLFQVRGNYR
jgi:hypothetical protein